MSMKTRIQINQDYDSFVYGLEGEYLEDALSRQDEIKTNFENICKAEMNDYELTFNWGATIKSGPHFLDDYTHEDEVTIGLVWQIVSQKAFEDCWE